jgi:hypothetical protein
MIRLSSERGPSFVQEAISDVLREWQIDEQPGVARYIELGTVEFLNRSGFPVGANFRRESALWISRALMPPLQEQATTALAQARVGEEHRAVTKWLISTVMFAGLGVARDRGSPSSIWISDIYTGLPNTTFANEMFPLLTTPPVITYTVTVGRERLNFSADEELFAGIYALWTSAVLGERLQTHLEGFIEGDTMNFPVPPWDPYEPNYDFLQRSRLVFSRYLPQAGYRTYRATVNATQPYEVTFDSPLFVQGMLSVCQWLGLEFQQWVEIYSSETGERLVIQ